MKLRWYGASAPRALYPAGLQRHRRAQSERFAAPQAYFSILSIDKHTVVLVYE